MDDASTPTAPDGAVLVADPRPHPGSATAPAIPCPAVPLGHAPAATPGPTPATPRKRNWPGYGWQRPRVLFVDHVARLSGGELALLRLLPELADSIEARVLLAEDGPLVSRLREAGISVEVLPMDAHLRDLRKGDSSPGRLDPRRVLALLRYIAALRRRIRELRPDVVHTNSLKSALYAGVAARLAGVPVVWHVRDRIAEDYLPRPAVRLVRLAARMLPTAVVANSRSTLGTLPAPRRGTVVHSPVPIPAPLPAIASRREPDADRSRLRVGIVGRLAEWKGQHVFLDAFARAFPGGGTEAWVIGDALFGEDAYARRLREQAERLGVADRVVWRGFREDVDAELAELDVLVHCSITPEPFGQVIVQGMAAGLPVVASAAGGPLEIIEHGIDGLLVPPGQAGALATALQLLAGNPELRRQLGTAAQASSARFAPEHARDGMLTVYTDLLCPR